MKTKITLLITLISIFAHSQSWQWGKRGGSVDQLATTGGRRQEEVFGIVTDSQKNIYTISYVGMNNLNVDGNTKTNFGDDITLSDVCLSSFSCDGTYRWSKIFGGSGYDNLQTIQIDAQDNIYVVGKFGNCQNNTYPPRIDNDFIIPQTPTDCSLMFIAKFNNSGNLIWIKRPQSSSVSFSDGITNTGSYGLSTDSAGNSYWLVQLPPGTYANGAFTVTSTGTSLGYKYYILKYDTNGNYLSNTYIDMQLTYGASGVKFTRNAYNGYYYFASQLSDENDTAVVGEQTVTHPAFIFCFNDQGQFQWLRQSTSTTFYSTIFWNNFQFDPQNNIYISGRIVGGSIENFYGMSPTLGNSPPFIMKLNPDASAALWYSFPNRGTTANGGIVLNGNEVGLTASGITNPYTWGGQTLTVSNINNGYEAIFARFNKDTGACLGLSRIVGDDGYDDTGCAITVDASGDYILGGGFGHQLTFTTNTIFNIGSQSDFFVAKYSTSVCSLSNDDFKEQGMELAPNPVENSVKINTNENLEYSLYNILGTPIKQGKINEQENTIDCSHLAQGTYLLQTTNQEGKIKNVKLLKK